MATSETSKVASSPRQTNNENQIDHPSVAAHWAWEVKALNGEWKVGCLLKEHDCNHLV